MQTLNPDDLRLNNDIEEVLIWRTDKKPKDSGERLIGCPLEWFDKVFPIVRGKAELAAALLLYRERFKQKSGRKKGAKLSRTVDFTNASLSAMGIARQAKYSMLRRLEEAGLVSVEREGRCAPRVTFHE